MNADSTHHFFLSLVSSLYRYVEVRPLWFGKYINSLPESEQKKVVDETLSLLEQGVMTPYSGQRFNLKDAKEAVKETVKPARGGKCLLEG